MVEVFLLTSQQYDFIIIQKYLFSVRGLCTRILISVGGEKSREQRMEVNQKVFLHLNNLLWTRETRLFNGPRGASVTSSASGERSDVESILPFQIYGSWWEGYIGNKTDRKCVRERCNYKINRFLFWFLVLLSLYGIR